MANDDYDGLPPADMDLDREYADYKAARDKEITHRIMVDLVANELADAGRGNDVARAASMAFACLQRQAFSRTSVRISARDRDRLLTLLMAAREPVLEIVRADLSSQRIPFAASAIESAAVLVICWSESKPWDSQPQEFTRDVAARVRWIRNVLHNICIENGYQAKKSDRARQVVVDLQIKALEVGRRYG